MARKIRSRKVRSKRKNRSKRKHRSRRIYSKKTRRKVSARRKRLIRKNKGKKKLMGGVSGLGWEEVPGHTGIMYNRANKKVGTKTSTRVYHLDTTKELYTIRGDLVELGKTLPEGKTLLTLYDKVKGMNPTGRQSWEPALGAYMPGITETKRTGDKLLLEWERTQQAELNAYVPGTSTSVSESKKPLDDIREHIINILESGKAYDLYNAYDLYKENFNVTLTLKRIGVYELNITIDPHPPITKVVRESTHKYHKGSSGQLLFIEGIKNMVIKKYDIKSNERDFEKVMSKVLSLFPEFHEKDDLGTKIVGLCRVLRHHIIK